MEVAMPMSGTAIDCYEDMFKEITRKLYGEDGLPELTGTERVPSQDRGLTPIDYDVDNPILKSEEHLTAFGLAALMQNGFPTTGILNSTFQQHKPATVEDKWTASEDSLQWTQSKIATYNPSQKLFRCAECDCVGYLQRVAEHWLGTHSNLRAFQCPQCPYESAWVRCVRMHLSRQHNINTDESSDTLTKNNPVLQEIGKYLQRLKNKLENTCTKPQVLEEFPPSNLNGQVATTETNSASSKRYSCTFCPYATDRRDLFTRHENIHREEKPFQCYVCQKQFNRADHVKKHFLRMHREHPYDLNRIRRHPPKNASGMSYYQKYNANSTNPSTEPVPSLSNINSLSIPNGFNNLLRNSTVRPGNSDIKSATNKTGSLTKGSGKKKGEKRFSCCYCSWSGVDNWCLKRHMNTHLKPFVCGLCDYKAARSERLATHVLKVHNKRACGKCSFLADDPAQLTVHQQEHHPLEQRNRSGNNILRNTSFNSSTTVSTPCSQVQNNLKPHEITAAAALLHSNRLLQADSKSWKNHTPKQHGAARLFNYLEASDGSEPESESRGAEDMSRINLSHRIQSDFPEAGDVSGQADEEEGDEMELPLFVCSSCGCEFEDDLSLETHQYTHRHSTTSPAKSEYSKENVNPNLKYRCRLCDFTFENQSSVISHMVSHSSLTIQRSNLTKRPRKQTRPKKMVLPFWELNEVEVLHHLNRNFFSSSGKYLEKVVARRGLYCVLCKGSSVSRYHTKASLALHYYWKHLNKKFKCEHCDLEFRHKYQCVLHASREHINKPILKSQTVPTKEPIHAVPAPQDNHFFNSQTVTVPEASAKLGMSFFDHSFIHSTNAINSHMPIIIPTFPLN